MFRSEDHHVRDHKASHSLVPMRRSSQRTKTWRAIKFLLCGDRFMIDWPLLLDIAYFPFLPSPCACHTTPYTAPLFLRPVLPFEPRPSGSFSLLKGTPSRTPHAIETPFFPPPFLLLSSSSFNTDSHSAKRSPRSRKHSPLPHFTPTFTLSLPFSQPPSRWLRGTTTARLMRYQCPCGCSSSASARSSLPCCCSSSRLMPRPGLALV